MCVRLIIEASADFVQKNDLKGLMTSVEIIEGPLLPWPSLPLAPPFTASNSVGSPQFPGSSLPLPYSGVETRQSSSSDIQLESRTIFERERPALLRSHVHLTLSINIITRNVEAQENNGYVIG